MKKSLVGLSLILSLGCLFLGSVETNACTTVLVGKNATADGSTLMARNEDASAAYAKHYYVRKANSNPTHYVSGNANSGFTIDLPAEQQKYTCYQEWNTDKGLYEESGINEANVGMSATETLSSTPPTVINDPLIGAKKGGLDEDSTLTVVLPYVTTAKEGVERLGQLIEKYGAYKTHGTIFSDKNEIWYFEVVSGHNWIAVKVPDDEYAVIVNRMNIKEVDLNDTENVMMSTDFKKVAALTGNYVEGQAFNVRASFDSTKQNASDTKNAPRVWDGQRTLSPSLVGTTVPETPTATFDQYELFLKADEKIGIADVEKVLSLHYDGTEYDTYAATQTTKFEAISKNSNMESHIIQMRQNQPAATTGVQWVELGVTASSTWVPFFSGISDTPAAYQEGTSTPDFESAYWTFNMTSALAKSYYGSENAVTTLSKEDAWSALIHPARTMVLNKMNENIANVDAEYATKFADYIALQNQAAEAKETLLAAQATQSAAEKAVTEAETTSVSTAQSVSAEETTAATTEESSTAESLQETVQSSMVESTQEATEKATQESTQESSEAATTATSSSISQGTSATTTDSKKSDEQILSEAQAAVVTAQTSYDDCLAQVAAEKTASEEYLTQVGQNNADYAMAIWNQVNTTLIRIGAGWRPINATGLLTEPTSTTTDETTETAETETTSTESSTEPTTATSVGELATTETTSSAESEAPTESSTTLSSNTQISTSVSDNVQSTATSTTHFAATTAKPTASSSNNTDTPKKTTANSTKKKNNFPQTNDTTSTVMVSIGGIILLGVLGFILKKKFQH